MARFLIVPVIFILSLAYALLNRDGNLRTWTSLRGDVREGRERIVILEKENAELRKAIDGFKEESFDEERFFREELELVRPGEVLVKLPDSDQ